MKAFEPSSCAPAPRGPKHFKPAASKVSTMPPTSGTSGPTTVSATRSFLATSMSAAKSVTARATLRVFGSPAVPALPGAHSTSLTFGDCASFHASACSRPPLPMSKTFTVRSVAVNGGSAACP